jgi:hypothetical protein
MIRSNAMEQTTKVHAPPILRPEWLQADPRRLIQSECGGYLVAYDPHGNSGAVYQREAGVWILYGPISIGEFLQSLSARRIHLPDGMDVHLWMDGAMGAAQGHA